MQKASGAREGLLKIGQLRERGCVAEGGKAPVGQHMRIETSSGSGALA